MSVPQSPSPSSSDSPATPEPPVADPVQLAESLKDKGNVAFRSKKYQDAIEEYSKAIGVYSSQLQSLSD